MELEITAEELEITTVKLEIKKKRSQTVEKTTDGGWLRLNGQKGG